ncbi:ATP-binding protein [Streptomyces sp. NPDC048045]|uniref:ATP-binding protein n=1 Tax=Streptomyces sp. NPDC048045 TaxID=3154710 RepID=UPI0034417E7A
MSRPFEELPYAFTVPPRVEAVPAVRDQVADRARRLGLGLDEELTHDLKLLTGELVANSVTHTRAACVVCVKWTGERIRVEVTDADPTSVTPLQVLPTDEHGRGLFLVAAVATAWGSEPCSSGKKTWFELAVHVAGETTATAACSVDGVPAEWDMTNHVGGVSRVSTEPVSKVGAHARWPHQAA